MAHLQFYENFLISLADKLDQEGNLKGADEIDKDFADFLKLLEEGKLSFDDEYFQGQRDPRGPYSNRGRGLSMYEMSEGDTGE